MQNGGQIVSDGSRHAKIRTADKARRSPTRAQAERTAKELLERIGSQQAQPASDTTLSESKEAGAEAVSVFEFPQIRPYPRFQLFETKQVDAGENDHY